MKSRAELRSARTQYEQALEKVMLEKTAWEALQLSYTTLLSSLQNRGLSPEQAQMKVDGYMQTHAKSFEAALKRLAQISVQFGDLLLPYRLVLGTGPLQLGDGRHPPFPQRDASLE